MAHINSAAIRGAITERLEGVFEDVRAMEDGEAEADLFEGADTETKAARALVRPVFSVSIPEIRKHPDSPMGPTTLILYDVRIAVRAAYHLQGSIESALDYEDCKAVAEDQADKFAQALTWPGSLLECGATGRATGITSGMLVAQEPLYKVTRDDPENALFEIEQNYSATVRVDAAIS